ncbi:unnamed protein product [Owenia fusiformis]|uniref:Uncharacterized protein n=1 Tax=Owenia fusiformis TaxID=6347 RepID=A0A8J1Y2C8_OWEFU|nr:unnamed protein product [Owenia fusiformis]
MNGNLADREKFPPLIIAKSLVDPSQPFIPIRLANLSLEPLFLYKNTAVATGEPIFDVGNLVASCGEKVDVEGGAFGEVGKSMENVTQVVKGKLARLRPDLLPRDSGDEPEESRRYDDGHSETEDPLCFGAFLTGDPRKRLGLTPCTAVAGEALESEAEKSLEDAPNVHLVQPYTDRMNDCPGHALCSHDDVVVRSKLVPGNNIAAGDIEYQSPEKTDEDIPDHLRHLIDNSTDNLSNCDRIRVMNFLLQNQDVFHNLNLIYRRD